MTTIVTLLGLWALLIAGRGTPIGRMLERGLIEMPARQIDRITRGHVLLALTLAGVIGLVFLILDYEGIRLMSMAAPEIATLLTMAEASTWLDVAMAAIVTASTLRLRTTGAHLRERFAKVRIRTPRPRRRRTRAAPPPANDDEPAPERRAA